MDNIDFDSNKKMALCDFVIFILFPIFTTFI